MKWCPALELVEHRGIAVPEYQCKFNGQICYSNSLEDCDNKGELREMLQNIVLNHLGGDSNHHYRTIGEEYIREYYEL